MDEQPEANEAQAEPGSVTLIMMGGPYDGLAICNTIEYLTKYEYFKFGSEELLQFLDVIGNPEFVYYKLPSKYEDRGIHKCMYTPDFPKRVEP